MWIDIEPGPRNAGGAVVRQQRVELAFGGRAVDAEILHAVEMDERDRGAGGPGFTYVDNAESERKNRRAFADQSGARVSLVADRRCPLCCCPADACKEVSTTCVSRWIQYESRVESLTHPLTQVVLTMTHG